MRTGKWVKALLAGLVGGVVGTVVKTLCETVAPPRAPGQLSPLGRGIEIVSTHFTGHPASASALHIGEPLVHWIFGIGAGIVYAVIAEDVVVSRLGRGALFGFSFWLIAHEIVLPLMNWSPMPAEMTLWEQGNEMFSHVLYGVGVELTRRAVRARL